MILNIDSNLLLLITIEGLDGTFKNTNTKNLVNYLNTNFEKYSSKVDIKSISFPRYEKEGGYFPKVYLNGKYSKFFESLSSEIDKEKDISEIGRKLLLINELELVSDFYLSDMFDFSSTTEINKPTIIIFDRYFYSMIYYLTKNIHKYNYQNINYMKEFYYIIINKVINKYKLEKTDILIKLYNNDKINNNEIIKKRNKNSNDIYENDFDYLDKVSKYYINFNPQYMISEKYAVPRFNRTTNNSIINIDVNGKDEQTILNEIVSSIRNVLRIYKLKVSNYYRYNK